MKTTTSDPILADLYRFREDHAGAFDYDVSAMLDAIIREQDALEKEGRPFRSYPPRRCETQFPFAPIDGAISAPSIDTPVVGSEDTPAKS